MNISNNIKSFIFYTTDGFTYDNHHKECNNIQILGHAEGETIKEALANFIKNQSYIRQQAFTNIMALQTLGDTIFNMELSKETIQ